MAMRRAPSWAKANSTSAAVASVAYPCPVASVAQPVARFNDIGSDERAQVSVSRMEACRSQHADGGRIEYRERPLLAGVERCRDIDHPVFEAASGNGAVCAHATDAFRCSRLASTASLMSGA